MIGLLEMRRRSLQFALVAAIFTLIAYLVLMIDGLGVGLNDLAGSAVRRFDADAIAYADTAGRSILRSELSAAAVERARDLPGVTASGPLAYTAATYRDAAGAVESAALLGYDPESIGEPPVLEGRPLTDADVRAVLADRRFLDSSGLKVGDIVTIEHRLASVEYQIAGAIDQGAFFFQPVLYGLRESVLDLKYGPATGGERPAASIILLQGENLTGIHGGFDIVDKATAFANIEGVAGQASTVASLRVLGYVIGALVIGAFFFVLTLQKVGQIGVLKAVGASSGFIVRQLLTQVMAVALIGLAVAVPLAFLTDRAIEAGGDVVPIGFTTGSLVTTVVALLVTAIAGALVCARQVVRVDPLIALGQQQ
jgi:putative ABC transport system permease protein